jgi:3-hydroxymyristoyl/3-hydroxydecanoyl-(acyl carrier protein) dehydratase
MTATALDIRLDCDRLFPLICVRDPYFALQDVRERGPGHVTAGVPVEQPLGDETGPIAAAEAGRHLAILGLVAAARLNPRLSRHYYLAHRATLERVAAAGEGPLEGVARAHLGGKREATAETELRVAGGPTVYVMSAAYHVVPAPAFERLNAPRRRELRREPRVDGGVAFRALRHNPYARPLALDVLQISNDAISATLGVLEAERCNGHFPQYPALPVAIVMGALSRLAGTLTLRRAGAEGARYRVDRAEVRADNLAFAGERLDFQVSYVVGGDAKHRLRGKAVLADGLVVGELDIDVSVAPRF